VSQLKALQDRFLAGGYRAASTSDLALVIQALRNELGDIDPVAPTQTAGDEDVEPAAAAEAPASEVTPTASDATPPEEPTPMAKEPTWNPDP
jgi:hypothetical protein